MGLRSTTKKNRKLIAKGKLPLVKKVSKKSKINEIIRVIILGALKVKQIFIFLKSGFTKWIIITLALTLIAVSSYFLFVYKKKGYVNGNVIFQGSTHFSYDNQQNPDSGQIRISPLCGCIFDHTHRGVEFFSKSFDVTTKYVNDTTSGTQYFLTCPKQDMSYLPHLYFKAKIYYIGNSINNSSYNYLDSIVCDTAKLINILSYENSLHFNLLGNYPIAALIPMKSSLISVIKESINNYNSFSNYYIQEKFLKDTTTEYELPMLDVLGRKIEILCNPKRIIINENSYEPLKMNKEIKSCRILLEVGFQLRLSQNKVDSFMRRVLDSTTTKKLMLTDWEEYAGLINLYPHPLNDNEFKELKYKIDTAHGVIESNAQIIGADYSISNWGLPRLSEFNGIYFFGQNLSNLICDEATGVCQFGNKSYYLDPSRKIEIKDLEDFNFNDEPVITPLTYNSSSNFTTKFKGKGKLYIDDEIVGESFIDNKWFASFLIYASLITGMVSIIGYLKALITHLKKRQFDLNKK